MPRPTVEPLPAVADAAMPWDVPVDDAVALISSARAELGDTFVVDSGDDRYLFLFSPEGVRSFYALDESVASKGLADWRMLRRKVPPELFEGRRTLPHDLFRRADVAEYLGRHADALDAQVDVLAADGSCEVFGWSRRLGHLMGLASWAGSEVLGHPRIDELLVALDGLDAADAFVRPELMASIASTDYATERAHLAVALDILAEVVDARRAPAGDLLDRIIASWDDEDGPARSIAADVVLVHLASMSNMFAALGWLLVDVVSRPDLVERIRAREPGLLEACAMESIRVAQRSVMLRHVLEPVTVDDGTTTYAVAPGATIATLVPVTNGDHDELVAYRPERWDGRKLVHPLDLAAKELVTTFGHGKHTCPAREFSVAAMTATVRMVVDRFDCTPTWTDPAPVPGQIGGVARAADPCVLVVSARP